MALDMNVALKINAGVTGQQAVDQLRTSMDRLDGTVGKMKGAFMALGGVALVGGFVAAIKGAIDTADSLNDLRQKTGIAVEELDALGFAAKLNGTTLEAVSGALGKMAKNMAEASSGSKEAIGIFAQFGISQAEMKSGSISTTEALARVADKIAAMPDGMMKAAAAQKVFGKSAAEIIPLLNAGGDAIRDAGAELDRMGGRMTGEMAAAADQFNDNMTKLTRTTSSLAITMANDLLPSLNYIAETFLKGSQQGTLFGTMLSGIKIVFETIVVLGANVGYVLVQIKNEIVGIIEQMGALARMDFKGFSQIGEKMRTDAAAARKEIDAFSEGVINAGRAPVSSEAKPSRLPAGSGGFDFGAGKESEFTKLKNQLTELAAKTGDVTKAQEILGLMRTEKYKDLNNQQRKELLGIAATIDAKKSQAETDKELKDATDAASKARDSQYERESYQINDFKTAQREKLELLQLEGQRINMTAVEYERRVQAIQHEYEVNRTVKDMLPETAAQYREVADATYAAQQAVTKLNYEQSRTFGAGAKGAFSDYLENIKNVATSTKTLFSNAFKGMEDSLVNFVMTGKLNFKDLARSILSDMARILIQQSVMKPLLGAVGSMFAGSAMTFGEGQYANGGAFGSQGEITAFAKGGIVNSPTMFKFAKGTGLMGEAGPEAIMPLQRGSDGKLGVRAAGAGGNTSVIVNVSVESGQTNTDDQGAGNLGRVIAGVVKQELINQKRPGGLLAA